jgi:hypothetical protein
MGSHVYYLRQKRLAKFVSITWWIWLRTDLRCVPLSPDRHPTNSPSSTAQSSQQTLSSSFKVTILSVGSSIAHKDTNYQEKWVQLMNLD